MRKQRFPRKRYIAFEFLNGGESIGKKALTYAIEQRLALSGKRIRFDVIFIRGGRGIVLTSHLDAGAMRELLNSFSVRDHGFEIRTLGTSGTILTLKQRFFRGLDLS